MGMLDGWRHDRSRAALAVGVKRITSFGHAPAIVLASANQMSRFPKVLAVVSDPDVTGFRINSHAPRVAQAISPNLAPCLLQVNKWVVFWNGVEIRSRRIINIYSQHTSEQIVQRLAGIPSI